MPEVSSTTPTISALPSARAPRRCATSGIPHAELLREHGVMFMVRRVEVDYLRPARLDEFADRDN